MIIAIFEKIESEVVVVLQEEHNGRRRRRRVMVEDASTTLHIWGWSLSIDDTIMSLLSTARYLKKEASLMMTTMKPTQELDKCGSSLYITVFGHI